MTTADALEFSFTFQNRVPVLAVRKFGCPHQEPLVHVPVSHLKPHRSDESVNIICANVFIPWQKVAEDLFKFLEQWKALALDELLFSETTA